jgi:hypothetical protein
LIGVGSSDLSFPALQTASLNLLKDNRLEIYPWRHAPSRLYLRKAPPNHSYSTQRNWYGESIFWRQLAEQDLVGFTLELISRLPTSRVYISIDKDCLKKDYALTNWEEGYLNLGQLLTMLELFRKNSELIGLDVVGDYSQYRSLSKIKAFISGADHPQEFTARYLQEDSILRVNEQTNLEILNQMFV